MKSVFRPIFRAGLRDIPNLIHLFFKLPHPPSTHGWPEEALASHRLTRLPKTIRASGQYNPFVRAISAGARPLTTF